MHPFPHRYAVSAMAGPASVVTLRSAEQSLARGEHGQALGLATQSYHAAPSTRALQVAGEAAAGRVEHRHRRMAGPRGVQRSGHRAKAVPKIHGGPVQVRPGHAIIPADRTQRLR